MPYVFENTEPEESRFVFEDEPEKKNPGSNNNLTKIPEKEGYIKGYKPYGEKGRGYYYIKAEGK